MVSSSLSYALLAEDDPDDRLLVRTAWGAGDFATSLKVVTDGQALIDHLYSQKQAVSPTVWPYPGLILLDINMPRKNGFETLNELKADREWRCIPVVMLTTSSESKEILRAYKYGASGFITKPMSFDGFSSMVKILNSYWFHIVRRPESGRTDPKDSGGDDGGGTPKSCLSA